MRIDAPASRSPTQLVITGTARSTWSADQLRLKIVRGRARAAQR